MKPIQYQQPRTVTDRTGLAVLVLLTVAVAGVLTLPPPGSDVLVTVATWAFGVTALTAVPFAVVWLGSRLVDALDSPAAGDRRVAEEAVRDGERADR